MAGPLIVMLGVVVCVAFAAIAFWSARGGGMTCRECGGGLPVLQVANQAANSALGDWSCPKCGTRFDRQGRARDQSRS